MPIYVLNNGQHKVSQMILMQVLFQYLVLLLETLQVMVILNSVISIRVYLFINIEYFLKVIEPTNENYKNLKFTTEWALELLRNYENYSIDDPKYYKDPHLLLHIGNLRFLYE